MQGEEAKAQGRGTVARAAEGRPLLEDHCAGISRAYASAKLQRARDDTYITWRGPGCAAYTKDRPSTLHACAADIETLTPNVSRHRPSSKLLEPSQIPGQLLLGRSGSSAIHTHGVMIDRLLTDCGVHTRHLESLSQVYQS